MRVGLIDVDGHNFPNLPLMKLSAWHKSKHDSVEWVTDFFTHYDIVYMSKVFSFTPDIEYPINADKVIKGGSGYHLNLINGKEIYDKSNDSQLPPEIEHIYPDYSLYPDLTHDTAYGFLSRGCPRGCDFCHVAAKEGRKSYKVADLSEFWQGQKNLKLLDPNLLACKEHIELLQQLVDCGAWVDITQGLDIRLVNGRNIDLIQKIKIKRVHFAWDNPNDDLVDKFKEFKNHTQFNYCKLKVYVLTNFSSTHEQDLYRVYALRELGYDPYIMIYDKEHAPQITRYLQRWVNNKIIFRSTERFEEYKP